jgi:RNA 2',3'-cyclic 3'-phosphodiesterase
MSFPRQLQFTARVSIAQRPAPAIFVTIFFDSIGLIYESPQELFTDLLANGFAIFAMLGSGRRHGRTANEVIAHEVASLLARVRRAPVELRLQDLDSFGGRKPRAVVARFAPTAELMELQAEHERLLQRVGLDPEGRKYTPHVTLARLRESSSRQVADYLAVRAPLHVPAFTVSRFVLFSSRMGGGGGPYVVEAAYPLAA